MGVGGKGEVAQPPPPGKGFGSAGGKFVGSAPQMLRGSQEFLELHLYAGPHSCGT